VQLYWISWSDVDALHDSRTAGDDAGFHLHGFEHHDYVAGLYGLTGRTVYPDHQSRNRTAVLFVVLGICAWGMRRGEGLGDRFWLRCSG
jgi:hypothetical protein